MIPTYLFWGTVLGLLVGVTPESILFPGNEKLMTTDESEIDNPEDHVDPMQTGSLLYDSQLKPSTPKKLLGYNILVRNFVSKESRYFRAHPTFMKCAQQTIFKLQKNGISVTILVGYKTAREVHEETITNKYLRSGCGMQLGIRDGSPGSVDDIASAVLQICPVILEREHRDLGLIIMSDRVHFHMSGPDSDGPLYQLDPGYSGAISDLDTWVQDEINTGLEPNANSDCTLYSALSNWDHHPAAKTQDQMVGTLDVKITRNMAIDFGRLIQYQGSNIEFEESEAGSSWCGEEGSPCPTCGNKIKGNSLENRCSDRVMSHRLLKLLNKLQRKVRLQMNDKLKVTEAWDEPHSAAPDGDSGTDELHYEGRAAKLQLVTSNTESNIGTLSQYAICLGADYVEHRGTYLYVAVKRAQYDPVKKTFPSSLELLSVDPPSESASLYSLPPEFSESDIKQYPLFDSSGRLQTPLDFGVTIGQFVSPGYRYFRLHPALVQCYSDVINQENKRRKDGDPLIEFEVVRGFLTNVQNKRKFDIISDKRFGVHNLGVALQLRYKQTDALTDAHTPYKLLYTVVDQCAPRFYNLNPAKAMGVGLYSDSVFVDIRPSFHMMKETLDNLPEGVDRDTFENDLEDRFLLAQKSYKVDPTDYDSACLFARQIEQQSCDFQHKHSEAVRRRRRRRSTETDTNDCIPTRDTEFCSSTAEHRRAQIEVIKTQLKRKHHVCRSIEEIERFLDGCFADCGTCMTGEVFESKQEHCNNLLHLIDFALMNREPDTTNIFLRSNENARVHACDNGADCIENAPLFSLLAPSVEYIYRPDPTKSVEEELYSSVNNPLPVYSLLEDMYAINASGIVKFWVKDDSEMTALKQQLETVMLYNKRATLIEIYVERFKLSGDLVEQKVQEAAREMVMRGCPEVTRETLTPFTVKEVPQEFRKRAAEPPSVRRQIRDYHKNFEARWAERNMLI